MKHADVNTLWAKCWFRNPNAAGAVSKHCDIKGSVTEVDFSMVISVGVCAGVRRVDEQ